MPPKGILCRNGLKGLCQIELRKEIIFKPKGAGEKGAALVPLQDFSSSAEGRNMNLSHGRLSSGKGKLFGKPAGELPSFVNWKGRGTFFS